MRLCASLLLGLLLGPAVSAQDITLHMSPDGRLEMPDLVPMTSPKGVQLPGLAMTLDRDHQEDGQTAEGESKSTWIGTIRGVPHSYAVFTSIDGMTAATIYFPGTGFLILPDGRIWKQDRQFLCGNPENPLPPAVGERGLEPTLEKAAGTTQPWEIRLALPFSKGAPALVGGAAALHAILLNQQDVLNESLRVSGLGNDLRITVVAARQVAYDESDPKHSGVNYVTFKNFGPFMKQNRADVLLMLVSRHPDPVAGSANQYTGDPTAALGIVDLHYLANGVLLHELGHLLSALHEQAYYACPSGGQVLGKDFVTIMWGGNQRLPDACAPESLHQFSNPQVIYAGSNLPTGNTTHCNACRVRAVAAKVSKFRN